GLDVDGIASCVFSPAPRGPVVIDDDVACRPIDPRMEAFDVAQRLEAGDDLEQDSLHQIVDIGLVLHPPGNERSQVAVQFLPRQVGRQHRSHDATALRPKSADTRRWWAGSMAHSTRLWTRVGSMC